MKSMKRKLLELCLSPDLGGLELFMVRTAKALDDTFDVMSVINAKGKLAQYYEGTQYRYETLSKRSNIVMFRAAKKLAKLIDAHGIEIVHLHWTKDIPVAVMAKILSHRKPKLVQTRNMTMTRFKNDLYHRFLYKHIDLMLPVSYQVAAQLKRFIPEEIRPHVEVLYMGSDEPELLDEKAQEALRNRLQMSGTFAVGMVGRIEEGKGQYLLIDAIAQLLAKGIDAQAFFVGHAMEATYLEQLQQSVRARGLDQHVHFLGFMKSPHHFMQACDAIVLATPCETFGLVLIEAMYAGTAVVGTNHCGPLEIIEEGKSGLLFEQGSADSLASALMQLQEDPAKRSRLAYNAKERVKELFASEKQFEKLATVLESL
jgi:glycosyltransferase involved in cell wall biosynthesis